MADLLRLSVGGAMPNGEKWTVNPVFGFPAPGLPIDFDTALAVAVNVAGVPVPSGMSSMNVAAVTVNNVRVEARDWDGTLENVAESIKSPAAAGSGGAAHSFQSSAVFSLRTANGTARGKGRLYWPATGATLSTSTLRLSDTDRDNYLAAFKTYLSGIEDNIQAVAGLSSARLVVWSRANQAGYYVNKIMLGNILDTQRRRRDALVEGYSQVAFP